jgi:hypothetical protein
MTSPARARGPLLTVMLTGRVSKFRQMWRRRQVHDLVVVFGAQGRDRTTDTVIFSHWAPPPRTLCERVATILLPISAARGDTFQHGTESARGKLPTNQHGLGRGRTEQNAASRIAKPLYALKAYRASILACRHFSGRRSVLLAWVIPVVMLPLVSGRFRRRLLTGR